MAWTFARRNTQTFNLKGRIQPIATWVPAGLLYGILTIFGWQRAVHPPLLFVTVAALAGTLLSGLVDRNQTHQ